MNAADSPALRRAALVLLTGLATLLAACESPVRLMPTPVSFRSGEIDPFEQAGNQLLRNDVPVLYATNRGAVVEKREPIHTILPSDRLRLGVAHVRIGDDTRRLWLRTTASETSDLLDPFVALTIVPAMKLGGGLVIRGPVSGDRARPRAPYSSCGSTS